MELSIAIRFQMAMLFVGVDEVVNGFEDLDLEYPTGEGETHLIDAVRTTILWRKENIVLPQWTPHQQTQLEEAPQQTPHSPALSPLPQSSPPRQHTPPPQLSPPRQRTPPEEAPQQNPPPPQLSLPRQRTPPPPPHQQRRKRPAAAPAASSTTTKKSRAGPSVKKVPAKLPYDMTEEETKEIVAADVKH